MNNVEITLFANIKKIVSEYLNAINRPDSELFRIIDYVLQISEKINFGDINDFFEFRKEIIQLNRCFNEFNRERVAVTYINLHSQILKVYNIILHGIAILEMKEKISNLQETISKLAPINYVKEKKEIKELIKYLDKKKKEADSIVGDIAENKNASKYIKFADDNRKAARRLFWASSTIMLGVALASLFIFWHIPVAEIQDIKILWLRFPILLIILMPAFFMMRESKKLKDKEFQYYDIACRIITSAPYIDGLNIPDTEKGKLKADLVKDFFGKPIECLDDGGAMPLSEIPKLIDSCAKLKK